MPFWFQLRIKKERLNNSRREEEDHTDDDEDGNDRPDGVQDLSCLVVEKETHVCGIIQGCGRLKRGKTRFV